MSCFAMRYKVFSNITHQPAPREARSNTALFFLEYVYSVDGLDEQSE